MTSTVDLVPRPCDWCELVMDVGVACTLTEYNDFLDGIVRERIPSDLDTVCRDCHAPPNGFHHPGCCVERCPRCEGQAISCGCAAEDEENE